MKKYLTFRNLLKCVAVVFSLVAFFFMFGDQLYVEALGIVKTYSFDVTLFGNAAATLSFVGYLFIGISALAACALIFIKVPYRNFVYFALALLLIVGAIFVILESSIYNGNVGGNAFHLTAFPILAGIFAIIAGVLLVASEVLKDKKLA